MIFEHAMCSSNLQDTPSQRNGTIHVVTCDSPITLFIEGAYVLLTYFVPQGMSLIIPQVSAFNIEQRLKADEHYLTWT